MCPNTASRHSICCLITAKNGRKPFVVTSAENVPSRAVMEIHGHSQLAMTTDRYSHVTCAKPQTPWIVSSSS
jgi:hypothetical protein